ncbi:MAG: glycogen/starch synthase, partial [Myxococcota bacterium]
MRVLLVASEAFPIVKTGGLADVVGALPPALRGHGVDARLLLPAYPGTMQQVDADPAGAIAVGDLLGAGPAQLVPFTHDAAGLRGWLLDCPALLDREGGPYLDEHGHDHHDIHLRFALLSRVAALVATLPGLTGFAVDLVHCHDWQAGLVGAYFAAFGGRRPPLVFTAHNLHFSGRFDPAVLPSLGLPTTMQQVDGVG